MAIGDGAMLPLSGVVTNSGTIALQSTGADTLLQLIQHGMTLQGGGHVLLSDSAGNIIAGTLASVTLNNVDNVIEGAGRIGNGTLTLINGGTITATGTQCADHRHRRQHGRQQRHAGRDGAGRALHRFRARQSGVAARERRVHRRGWARSPAAARRASRAAARCSCTARRTWR